MRITQLLALVVGVLVAKSQASNPELHIAGELRQWHKITLTMTGPNASEDGEVNPFLDYRFDVKFRHAASGLTYRVPGYFAADGNAAESGATGGNQWRAHLSPDHEGIWDYEISFRTGTQIAVSDDLDAGEAVLGIDGLKGSFEVGPTNKTGRDFRGRGRLQYVGKNHLKFAGRNRDYFLKAGVDSPENFLAYRDFDGEFKSDGDKDHLVKDWSAHEVDWNEGDPTWQGDKGKGIIGAVNYLSAQGLNAFSFLTLNIGGDDQNVFPFVKSNDRLRIDCSRMDQWEVVFSHATRKGMYLHFKTQECENVNLLDAGNLGPERKLYYRELIARFSHHLALNWNLGEEVGYVNPVSTKQKVEWAAYFAKHDPYRHHIVIHNGNKHYDLLGNASDLTGFSLQTSQEDFRFVHGSTLDYLRRSQKAGKPWVVACDEPGDAQHALVPDAEDPEHDNARANALWGNFMAGGAGIEWYFGYKHAHSDLTCQDYRVREKMWIQSRLALDFFYKQNIPFWMMKNTDSLVNSKQAYCLSQSGEIYLVYRKSNLKIELNLAGESGEWQVAWFNPRNGGDLQHDAQSPTINADSAVELGEPPFETDRDWLAVITPKSVTTSK